MTETSNDKEPDEIIGWISFEYSGSVRIYASDPLAGRVAAMSPDELKEHFNRDAMASIDHWSFDWQPR